MRSLLVPRDRMPHVLLWLTVTVLVVAVQMVALPQSHRHRVELRDMDGAEREALLRALDAMHLTPTHLAWYWLVAGCATFVMYLAMGWLLVRRGQPAGFSTYLAIVVMALSAASYPPDIDKLYPGRPLLQTIILGLTVIAVSGFFILPLVFPDGRFVPRWTMLVAGYIVASFALLGNQPGILGSIAFEVASTLILVTVLIGAPIYRYRRVSTPDQRRQTRWVVLGFVIGLPAFFIGDAMMRSIDATPMGIFFLFGFMVLIQVGFNAPFLAVGMAILFHHLFDIDVIVSRTLGWLAMTLAVIGAYIGIVLGIGALLGTDDNLVLSLLATGLVAVAFQPVRARVQRTVDRFVYGERDDPYAVLSRIGHRIEDTLSAADLLPQIVRTTADALRLPYVALYLDRTGGPELVAATGTAALPTLRLPLIYGGQSLGALEVTQRSPGDAFSAADRRLLDDLSRQIGIVAHTVTLADELQRSREAIITSREEERRRLRRDLHDGLGAQLAALIMQARAVRSLVRHDPEAAEHELHELSEELKVAVDDVRRLVHGLRPPALDELGLAGALRARLDRLHTHPDIGDGTGLAIRFDAREPLPALPAAVEVATMHIVAEAVTNAVRHARARHLVVSITHEHDTLIITIEDDGIGFRMSDITPGIGIQSMRERARELGGTWTMASREDGSGCRIDVRLPAPVAQP